MMISRKNGSNLLDRGDYLASYKEGYVAFLDILGFSHYIENADADNVAKLFDFIKRLKSLFNSNTGIEMDFFSDSIILMTNTHELSSFLFPIYLAESYLAKELGLLFRGAVTFGKYYHDNTNSFGPGIVKAYQLGEGANYSRIIIDDALSVPENSIDFFIDLDGSKCFNVYSFMLFQDIPQEYDGTEYKKDELFSIVLNSLSEIRADILRLCDLYWQEKHIDKYLWRTVPFNYLCDYICKNPETVDYLEKHYTVFSPKEAEQIRKKKIAIDEILCEEVNLL